MHVVRLFSTKDIPKGSHISEEMITVKRDTYEIDPEFYNIVLGREAKVEIKADFPFTG